MRSPSPRSSSPISFQTRDALLHGHFTDCGLGGNSGGSSGGSSSSADSCPNSPGAAGSSSVPSSPSSCTYTLTLTSTHIHVQRISPRPGKEGSVLLPLSELAGCNCPRAPAPPLLMLYWYPVGRRRRGVAKRRQVRAYMAESRAEAEKWNTAVQCLLRGIDISVYTEFSKSLLPRPRRLLLLVNPFSGRGLAMQWCQTHILPMISEANISYNLIQTERQNHARELIREISLHEWDGIVIVSGDGLLHEVINGLMDRPDWEQAIKTPVGILPCGSGNALAGSINHYAGYDMCLREPLLINCCFLLCRGGVRPMDLVSVITSPSSSASSNLNGRPSSPKRLYSFLSVAWGFVSDVDIESERYRGLGSARFTLGTLVRLASLRSYKGRLSYLPPGGANSTPEVPSQTPHRPLSRSITEGLEGYCRMPIHRTCSDMGLSEQRSLQKDDREREREARNKERQRRRGRVRGRGVVRTSSLAEDREREMEAEERMERTSGSSAESNGRLECNQEEEEEDSTRNMTEDDDDDDDVEEGKEVEERMEGTSGSSMESNERQESESREKVFTNDRGDEQWNGMDGAPDMRQGYIADEGKEEDEEVCLNSDQQKALRKNSAPSNQIATAFFSQPIGADSEQEIETPAYEREDEDLTFFRPGPFPADPARERALTISSPFRRSRFSLSKPKTSVDQNRNQKSSVSKPRPLSLLHQSNSNSLPPKFPSLSLSLSPTPPSSPANMGPHTCLPSSTSSSPFPFDLVQPGKLKPRSPFTSTVDPPPKDNLLPPLDQPLPTRDWVTIEGDFVLVLAIYQSHLGADLFAAPHAQFDDGLIHLTFVRAGISRATLLRLFLAMERGTHLSLTSPYVSHVSARAFRLQPLSSRGTLTVDGELVPYGPLQAQIHPSMARVIVGDPAVKITRI